ncbi:MAG: FAD:protein FMN transferase [Gemmatales bacterium]|nr:FAD:protein FMN transferase [Gemmatales bacterium]MDW8387537.1 FAD:protein FMN transferase [Gemmatales bacterium]
MTQNGKVERIPVTIPPLLALLLTASTSFLQAEPASAPSARKRFEFAQPHMGTQFRIVLYAADEATARRSAEAAFARIAELDARLSDYREDSELMRLCQQAGGSPVAVSEDLFRVLKAAQEMARLSGGAFDVTIGPLSRLWRRSRRQKELPTPRRLEEARALVGFEKLILDEQARTVRLSKPGMLLDLGGIAKGFAADEAQRVLRGHGIVSALVAAGGDIVLSDPPPDAPAWRIGIAPLDDPNRPPSRFLWLKNAAVSTSGDAEQFVEINGVRYSHILDPKTGLGLTGRQSVTVVAPNGMTSDSLATAVSVLRPEEGLKLVEQIAGAAALIVVREESGDKEYCSSRWPRTESTGKP